MAKTLTNIENLKAMINANVLECVELKQWSVQVYNLNEYEEYTNIYKVEKINGRYYMFDLADKKYMLCRQRDAEWFAGEFLHFVERERETVAAYVESIKKYGKTCINEAYYIPFTDALDAEGIEYRPIAGTLGYCNQGHVICCYEITSRPAEPQTTTEDNTPAEAENEPETATECENECHRLECREGGALVEIATGETVGTWGTDAAGFYAQLDGAHHYNYVHIVNDPTEGTETATEDENDNEQDNTPTEAENDRQSATETADGYRLTITTDNAAAASFWVFIEDNTQPHGGAGFFLTGRDAVQCLKSDARHMTRAEVVQMFGQGAQ